MEDDLKKPFMFTCFLSVMIVVSVFGYAYLFFGHHMLPIGWDTPHYVGQISTVLKNGLVSFIEMSDYYNFLYTILLSTLAFSGISPFILEIFVPIILCALTVIMVGLITRKFLEDKNVAIYATLLAASWFMVFRLGADLHPNLLAVTLLLAGFALLLPPIGSTLEGQRTERTRYFLLPLLIVVSFIHVETGIFFAFVLLVCVVLFRVSIRAQYPLKKMLIDASLVVVAVLPSIILYVRHLDLSLLSYGSGILVSYPPLSYDQWIGYLGVILPISMLGLFLILQNVVRKNDGTALAHTYNVFIGGWALSSLGLVLVHYVCPAFFIFSERAMMLFPTPFVASVGLKAILDRLHFSKMRWSAVRNRRNLAGAFFVLVVLSSSVVFTGYELMQHMVTMKVWITSSAYERLQWISDNYKLDDPIFMYNDYDEYAGGLAAMYDNWVQALYGDHYSYVGRLDLLLSLRETPFISPTSQIISGTFLREMQKEGVFTVQGIIQHRLIIISDFYLPRPLPLYYRQLFDEVIDGVFVLNSAKLEANQNTFIPLYAYAQPKMGSWYPIEKNWAESFYAWELYIPNPIDQSYCEIQISIPAPGNYTFLLRYFDGSGSEIRIELGDSLIGEIRYKESAQAESFKAIYFANSSGLFKIRVTLTYASGLPQYASLDYLSISRNNAH